jgi:hypothetical protein
MLAPTAASQSGWRTRSSRILGDRAFSVLTRFVLRWSATADMPRNSAAARAVHTAITWDNVYPPYHRPDLATDLHPVAPKSTTPR